MLANDAIVCALATALRTHRLAPYVLDPVMVATSGAILLAPDALPALLSELVPLADLVTPNLSEAATLVGHRVTDVAGMEHAARLLVDRAGARAALVTGGHLKGPLVVDVLYDGGSAPRYFRHKRVATSHTHGTGCTLSAAIAAHLALGLDLPVAVESSIRYVSRELRLAKR
jgi:hydroxymethylpyrimidine/phosphomethylpyrimidine kinase